MKLCAGILYWGRKEELKTVELHGAGSQELTLSSVQTCASSVWGSTGT